jgi:2,4-dienoyl-CoA reductase-like NADH-dependent reductase (Old Yellow Enzyme family)
MTSSVGMMIPNIWKNKSHVPNHQPVIGHVRILPRIHMNSAYICIQAAHVGGMVWVKKKYLSLSPIESRSNWWIHIINISKKTY